MEITVQREPSKDDATFGKLDASNGFTCYTLEDVIRERPRLDGESDEHWVERWKIIGRTAIPAGRFRVFMQASPKFHGKPMPHLQGVPGFYFIMIHPLNLSTETEGCLGVGAQRVEAEDSPFHVGNRRVPGLLFSKGAFDILNGLISDALGRNEEVWIEILNPPQVAQ